MPEQCAINGKANEFAYMKVFYENLSLIRKVEIRKNNEYYNRELFWNNANEKEKTNYIKAAQAAYRVISEYEPLIEKKDNDVVLLYFQGDHDGEDGDVRDIIISRTKRRWEIGISIKHNHFALKHSRISPRIDFCNKWFGYNCSQDYWNEVTPIFDMLKKLQIDGVLWSQIPDKMDKIYCPLLTAWKKELLRQYDQHGEDIPCKLMEYLFAKYDFYKSIGLDARQLTEIQIFNFKGTLGKESKNIISQNLLMPSRIVHFDFIPGRKNILELYLNNGWQLSFRLHNASTQVEPSLKFDIQTIGMPASIITIKEYWE